jgi:DNA-binding transcriptional ArsR family regulator
MEAAHTTQSVTRSSRAAAAARKPKADFDLQLLTRQAAVAARMLKLIGNERRLLILCFLAVNGEMRAGELMSVAGLSQSALSQHLAKMRADGLVTFRRESQTLHYRISDPRAALILKALKDIYCGDIPRTAKRRR